MLVSVLMITYNHLSFIESAIKGVLSQSTTFKVELIISDDSSDKNISSLVNKCISENTNDNIKIKFFRQASNIGMYKNFEFVFNEANGDYIALCEGDDYWIDNAKLQKQVDFLESNPNYKFCYTRFKTYSQEMDTFELDNNSKYFKSDKVYIDFTYKNFHKGWHIGNQTLVFKKTSIESRVISKFPKFKDVHLISQLLKKGKGACLNSVTSVYRIHDGGIHSGVSSYKGYKVGYETHKEIYKDNPNNNYLKLKYEHSLRNFINANIRKGQLYKAFKLNFELLYSDKNIIMFLKHIKRIIVKQMSDK